MAAPFSRVATISPSVDLTDAQVMTTKKSESDGVIPRWLLPSLLTILGILLAQLFGAAWWAATMTERLNGLAARQQIEQTELLRRLADAEEKSKLLELQIQTMREKLAESGWRATNNGRTTLR